MAHIYVLQLRHGKYYVGKTDDPEARFRAHCAGTGALWTRLHPPVRLLRTLPADGPGAEDRETLALMARHGTDNVRGGSFVREDLGPEVAAVVRQMAASSSDACHRCGRDSHWAATCYARTHADGTPLGSPPGTLAATRPAPPTCRRCGRGSHTAESCYARTHADGTPLGDYVWCCGRCHREFGTKAGALAHERRCPR